MRYGLVKSALDAHTLGISSVAQLLQECGYTVFISDATIAESVDKISNRSSFEIFKKWITDNKITHVGFSYRLDPTQALESFVKLVRQIENDQSLSLTKGGLLKEIYFAGLPESCNLVDKEFRGRFKTFFGDETPMETLQKLGVPESRIPRTIRESAVYDELRLSFGEKLIREENSSFPGL